MKIPTYRQLMQAAKTSAAALDAVLANMTPEQLNALADRFEAAIVAVERKLTERGWISAEELEAIRAQILPDPAHLPPAPSHHPLDEELCLHDVRRADCPLCEAMYNAIEADTPAIE